MSRPLVLHRAFLALAGAVLVLVGAASAGSASPVSQVDRHPQTVSFGTLPPDAAIYGEGVYSVVARATSGLPVTLSIAPDAAGVCALSDSTVMFTGAGTCTVLADQAGDDYWLPAEQVSQSFVIGKATPTLGAYSASKGVVGLTPTTFSADLRRRLVIGSPSGPIAGEVVTFTVAGRAMCSATTNSDGVATCDATIGLRNALNESSYGAVYDGSTNYWGVTATGSLR
jgi:hypothetical protein